MDSFDEIYAKICENCKQEKVCERCCGTHHNIESDIAKTKCDYSFSDEAKKICGCVKKILNGKQKF